MYRCIQLVLLGHFSVEQNTHLVLFLVEDDSFFSCSSLSETVLNLFLGLGLGFGAAKFSVLSGKKKLSSSCWASLFDVETPPSNSIDCTSSNLRS